VSALSEAIDRAQKRLDHMSPEDRARLHIHILQEELRRPVRQIATKAKGEQP